MDISVLFSAMPGAVAQGLIWGIMAIGVYITYKILDVADLTVDGSMCTGGAVSIMMMLNGYNVWVSLLAAFIAGMLAGLVTGIFHTFMGIPAILAGILTQLALYSINLKIMGRANQAISVMNYDLLVSLRNVKNVPFNFCGSDLLYRDHRGSVLVLWNRTWMFSSCDRMQSEHEPCTGNQYEF